ncbi:hypothetical protein D9M73_215160 [compost metagenome]
MGAASSLHRSCHGQLVVRLDEQAAACRRDAQGQLQLGYRLQGGFDPAGGFLQPVAKHCQQRLEAGQATARRFYSGGG